MKGPLGIALDNYLGGNPNPTLGQRLGMGGGYPYSYGYGSGYGYGNGYGYGRW